LEQVGEAQVGYDLRLVNRQQPFDGLELDEDPVCTVLEPSDLAIFLLHSLPSGAVARDCAAGRRKRGDGSCGERHRGVDLGDEVRHALGPRARRQLGPFQSIQIGVVFTPADSPDIGVAGRVSRWIPSSGDLY